MVFAYSDALMVWLGEATSQVRPSGADFATNSLPMMVFAPGLLSVTMDCFHKLASCCAKSRLTTSVPPPGGKGTTTRTGLAVGSCARETVHSEARVRKEKSRLFMGRGLGNISRCEDSFL